ncbi:nitroreductase family protein, partial [Candidatus Bathyarchaeota archaeon]|nr:nitroreductase family protein [Candidatus Bathyarchaeota archaeon]
KILEAGRLAPSGGNRQPWSFIVVRKPETKKKLAAVANLQRFIADADTVLIALGDPAVSKSLYKQDPMIAIEHMVLASTALGYGTCWIGAFNENDVKEIAKVPENMTVIALLPIGVPDETPPPKPRRAFKEVFFKESYGKPMEM